MKSNIKRITALLLTAVLCLCFASCVNNTSVKSNSNHESSAEQTTTSTFLTQEEEETTEASHEKEESTAKEEITDSSKVTSKQNKDENTTAKSSTKPTTTAATTSKKEITCTLTIECKAILSNMDDLKPGHEKYVPQNGYILNNYTCAVNSGDTVFDVLEKACDDNSIILTSHSSGYGVYVAGINNLDEFDCGSQSGWKYKVNGVDANRSCGYYKLTGGENIVFYYTVTG